MRPHSHAAPSPPPPPQVIPAGLLPLAPLPISPVSREALSAHGMNWEQPSVTRTLPITDFRTALCLSLAPEDFKIRAPSVALQVCDLEKVGPGRKPGPGQGGTSVQVVNVPSTWILPHLPLAILL